MQLLNFSPIVHLQVPYSRASLNHDDVFILDTESKIYQFNGATSSIQDRAKSLEVVQYIKDTYHHGKCEVAIVGKMCMTVYVFCLGQMIHWGTNKSFLFALYQMMESLLQKLTQENFGVSLEALHQLEKAHHQGMILRIGVMQENFICNLFY